MATFLIFNTTGLTIPDDPNVTPQGPVLQRFPLAVTPTKRIPLSSPSDWGHGGKYFDLAGIRLPSTIGELKASSSPRSKILWMLDCGATLAAIDTVDLAGHQCTRLRLITDNPERKAAEQIDDDAWLAKMRRISAETEESLQQMLDVRRQQRKLSEHRMFIFYLDPKLGYALRRSEERNDDGKDGSLLVSIDCEQFQPLNGRDLILPRKCILREYEVWNLPGTHFPDPTVSRTYEITDLKFDPIAQERFSLSYTAPGSEIHETLDADDTQSWGVIQEDGTLRDPRR